MKVSDFLVSVQSQATAMIPFEQVGIQNIANVSLDAREACSFSSLLVIQPQEFSTMDATDTILVSAEAERSLAEDSMQTSLNHPLVLICTITDNSIELRLFFRPYCTGKARNYSHVLSNRECYAATKQ